ncbi:MAG: DUF5916 domain-containing protein [Bacteroidota bacterium]
MKYFLSVVVAFLLFVSTTDAQKINANYRIVIKKTDTPVIVDGVADDPAWQGADVAKDFYNVLPMDTSFSRAKTEVMMAFDDENIYLIAICHHALPGPYFVESLKRDWIFGNNDNFIFFMDPFDDQINGFTFGTNAAGAQWDGIEYEGSRVNLSWDNKWTSEVKSYPNRYVFEMSLPFKSIRYKKGIMEWGINFSRLDLKTTEKSAWAPVPRQFPTSSLAYSGVLVWDEPPPAPGPNVSLIPYTLARVTKDYENNKRPNYQTEIGGDAKISLTPSLNLDLTVNPDFSQVDVDRQVTNLDRFELFFPERRQFFLENADLFATFGYERIRPFFSRRIGLRSPIQFGARLSGKLDKNWRIGVMDMQTGPVEDDGLSGHNFAALALQRQLFSRSNITLLMVNKQSLNNVSSYSPEQADTLSYNRNIGLEYKLATSNNLWTGKALFLKSLSPVSSGKDFTVAGNLSFQTREWSIEGQYEYVGADYTAEVGYVPRTDFIRINPEIGYNFFPKKGFLNLHGPSVKLSNIYSASRNRVTDKLLVLGYGFRTVSQHTFRVWTAYDFVELQFPFDPTNSGKLELPTGSQNNWVSWGTNFQSKPQSLFTYGFETRYGGYYQNGTRLNLSTDLGYRFQPYVNFAMSSSFNRINMMDPWGVSDFWLIGPRLDITFTNKLYLTTFAQYNEQIDNININSRLQWRYAPASDLFIVYSDNYFPAPINVKNRSLVFKLTYWWNI